MTQKNIETLGINVVRNNGTIGDFSGNFDPWGYRFDGILCDHTVEGIVTDGTVTFKNGESGTRFSIIGATWLILAMFVDGEKIVALICDDNPPIEELPVIKWNGKFFAYHQDGTLWI